MSMKRKTPIQPDIWVPYNKIASGPGHRFYEKLNELLKEIDFDQRVEDLCEQYYAQEGRSGRPSIPPGVYFRMLLLGYFEGIESERNIAWRCADSLSMRAFIGYGLAESTPDHSSMTRIRQRLNEQTHEEVFKIVLELVERKGLLKGQVIGVDSTYLRADASMKNIIRKDTNQSYKEYLKELAVAEGIESPTEEDCRRMDKKRKGRKTSNKEWKSTTDEDARIAKIKDGRTRLAYKPEHVVDLESGAIVAVEMYHADKADSATVVETAVKAKETIKSVQDKKRSDDDDIQPPSTGAVATDEYDKIELVADKGYHKAETLEKLSNAGFRTYIPERKQAGDRQWDGKTEQRQVFHENRARVKRKKGKAYQKLRGQYVERPFALICETGGGRRTRLRGRVNVKKQYLMRVAAANLGLIMRKTLGFGTPRQYAALVAALLLVSRVSLRLGDVLRPLFVQLQQVMLRFFPLRRNHHAFIYAA